MQAICDAWKASKVLVDHQFFGTVSNTELVQFGVCMLSSVTHVIPQQDDRWGMLKYKKTFQSK